MVSLTYYLTSPSKHIIKDYLHSLDIHFTDTEIESSWSVSKKCYQYKVHSVLLDNYLDCDNIQIEFLATIKKERITAQNHQIIGLTPVLVFDFGFINQEDSTPPLTLWKPLLSFCVQVRCCILIDLQFHQLDDTDGEPHAGAYFYAYPPEEKKWDMSDMERIAGINNQIAKEIRDKGGEAVYGESFHHSWGVEVHFDNCFPEKPARELMTFIECPEELGQYCARKRLKTHVDITRYGIYSPHVHINIPLDFIVFCHQLQVEWIDVDMMI